MNQMTICLIIFILTLLAYAFLSSRVSMAVISLFSLVFFIDLLIVIS